MDYRHKRRTLRAILILSAAFPPACARGQKGGPPDPPADLDKIADNYKIEVNKADLSFPVTTTHGKIEGKSADAKAVQEYAALFGPEFTLYPPALVRKSQLKRVVLCCDLSFADQRRNAVPDYEHDTLYLDVSRGTHSKPYLRTVIHHEFFHIIDYRDDGNVYRDERWEALNPAKFKYGRGGRGAQDQPDTSILTDRFPGFLNHYSTTGVEEDKAEMFAHLITDSTYVEGRAKADPVLKAKVGRMKELLAAFCPEVDEKFWERAGQLKRAEK